MMFLYGLIAFFAGCALALPHSVLRRASQGHLFLADEGVGHRSTPVPEWRTSIRRIDADGSDASTIQQFGTGSLEAPTGASALTYDHVARQLYIATGSGIIRTELDGSSPTTIIQDGSAQSLTISRSKLYYGTSSDGYIKRANLDGSDIEALRNVSLGIDYILPSYSAPYSYAAGIVIDEANDLIYWSQYTCPSDLSCTLPDGGSIRRAPLHPKSISSPNSTDIEILANGLYSPHQLRLLKNGTLYWAEADQYYSSPTALKRAYFPPTKRFSAPNTVSIETLIYSTTNWNMSLVFPYGISGFALDEESGRMWVTAMSNAATQYGRVVEMGLDGQAIDVLNTNVTEIGVPVGVEYVSA